MIDKAEREKKVKIRKIGGKGGIETGEETLGKWERDKGRGPMKC